MHKMGLPAVNWAGDKSGDVFVEALNRLDPFQRRVETLAPCCLDPTVFIESARPGGLIIRCSRRSEYGQEAPKMLYVNCGMALRSDTKTHLRRLNMTIS